MLVQRGTLRVGDSIVAGDAFGRVRAMLDEHGEHVDEAGPSRPVQVLGLTVRARRRRQLPGRRRGPHRPADRRAACRRASATPQLAKRRGRRHARGPLQGAREGRGRSSSTSSSRATCPVRSRPSRTRCSRSTSATRSTLRIIDRGVGAITENDVNLAVASDAVIIGFNVRPEGKARELADREGVDVRYYSVIYQAIDEVEAALKGMLKPEYEEAQLGTAEVREVFRSTQVRQHRRLPRPQSGTIRRNTKARLVRDGAVVADNLTIDSLRRFKDDATEVREGFECGIGLGSFNDIKVDDVIETFEMREKRRATSTEVAASRLGCQVAASTGARRRPCTSACSASTCCSATCTR